eukprot:5422133-Amphidinium_carterae.1
MMNNIIQYQYEARSSKTEIDPTAGADVFVMESSHPATWPDSASERDLSPKLSLALSGNTMLVYSILRQKEVASYAATNKRHSMCQWHGCSARLGAVTGQYHDHTCLQFLECGTQFMDDAFFAYLVLQRPKDTKRAHQQALLFAFGASSCSMLP